jgi:hypothetical protein
MRKATANQGGHPYNTTAHVTEIDHVSLNLHEVLRFEEGVIEAAELRGVLPHCESGYDKKKMVLRRIEEGDR